MKYIFTCECGGKSEKDFDSIFRAQKDVFICPNCHVLSLYVVYIMDGEEEPRTDTTQKIQAIYTKLEDV